MVTYNSIGDVLESINAKQDGDKGRKASTNCEIRSERYEPWECLCKGKGAINIGGGSQYKQNEHGRWYLDMSNDTPNYYVWCRCKQESFTGEWVEHCVRNCGLSFDVLKRHTFDRWHNQINPSCNNAMQAAKRFAEGKSGTPWIFLQSQPGLGKTHILTAAVGLMAARGVEVIYYSAPALMDAIKADFDAEEPQDVIDKVTRVRVLVVDDIGAEYETEWTRSTFHAILDSRYSERRPTMLATNMSLEHFPPRLYSRFQDWEVVDAFSLTGNDVRQMER